MKIIMGMVLTLLFMGSGCLANTSVPSTPEPTSTTQSRGEEVSYATSEVDVDEVELARKITYADSSTPVSQLLKNRAGKLTSLGSVPDEALGMFPVAFLTLTTCQAGSLDPHCTTVVSIYADPGWETTGDETFYLVEAKPFQNTHYYYGPYDKDLSVVIQETMEELIYRDRSGS
jgi:hypothetical protein